MITDDELRQILPNLSPEKRAEYLPHMQMAMAEFGITTRLREAAFIAQIAHESQNLARLEENLNYSAQRLRQVFPRRFPTDAAANAVARQPERIANVIYANRIGNGPPESGDGFRYRGRGFIQLTGRANYREFGNLLGLNLEGDPDQAATPAVAFRIAAAFWKSRGCNQLADGQQITNITKRINGGTIGLAERIALFGRAKRILGDDPPPVPVPTTRGLGGARTRSVTPPVDEGREVPKNLSRGIMPGVEFAAAAKKGGKKRAAGKKSGAKKSAGRKSTGKKGGAKKTAAKKSGAKKSGAKKSAKKGGAKKSAGKGGAKKSAGKGGAKKGAAKKGGSKKRR